MQEFEYFTEKEVDLIYKSTENERHRTQILLMADAGLRVSEVTDLKWSDCDFKKRIINVNSLKKRGENEKRMIPMTDRLYQQFAKLIEKSKTNDLKGYIFTGSGGEPVGRGSINKMLKEIEAELPSVSNIHPHKLRHTFATKVRSNGAELMDIRDLLGHEKVETTLIYAHASPEDLRRKIEGKKKKSIIQRLKSFFFPEKRQAINVNFIDRNFVIGRNEEIAAIQTSLEKELHIVLTGPIGIGKSHIIENLQINKPVLELDNVKDFKKSLLNIILYLFNDDKESAAAMITGTRDKSKWEKKMSTESLQNLITVIKGICEKNEYILKIGDIDDLTPTVIKALDSLKSHFQIITTSRKLKPEHTAFLWNFEKIEVKTLDRTNSLKLFQRLTEDLAFENIEFTRNRVFDTSEGNPKIIVELAERFRKEPVLDGSTVDDITQNYLGRQVKEIDLSIYLFLIFLGLMVFRFIGKANGDTDLRTVGGLIAIVLMFGRFFFNSSRRKSL
ncbi:MAG: tyrosine-type recombinase/integrase [Spirosomaceae bacterium]|jgi:hypothetical protein|nr:tyrosine-type recombinase/integrase [Spirosomataceae bacterium]